MKTLLASLLVFLSVTPGFAAETRYYDVEVVIFETRDPVALRSEHWPQTLNEETPSAWIELGLPFTGDLPDEFDPRYTFVPLPEDNYQLNQEVKTLEEAEGYRVLMHLGWRQPGMDRQRAIPVRIQRLIPPVEGAEPTAEVAAPAIAEPGVEPGVISVETAEAPVPLPDSQYMELRGFIRIALARYLHVSTDLSYQVYDDSPAVDPAEGEFNPEEAAPGDPIYHLHQTRRMRSKELHYFDHPVLGALILITPFEPPAEAAAATPPG